MRRRNIRQLVDDSPLSSRSARLVKRLDAFPKVPDDYRQQSSSGGAITIVCFAVIAVLVVSEIVYYTNTDLVFDYQVDRDFTSKLAVNVDITVAMSCRMIGADILDVTSQNTLLFGSLEEEDTVFELTPNQRKYWTDMQQVNSYIKEEYHALHKVLWKTAFLHRSELPERETGDPEVYDACRLHGTMHVNKVSGNFHITAGKSFPHPAGHAHLSAFLSAKDYNFSHRIDHFSFGTPTAGVINPLDGGEKIASDNYFIYQYHIKIVPTEVKTYQSTTNTEQYSVTENERAIDHSSGSHGVPGIFFKYDFSSLKVKVEEKRKPLWQFLVRLCGIVGGVFATSGIINIVVGACIDCFCCRFYRDHVAAKGSASSTPYASPKLLRDSSIDMDTSSILSSPFNTPASQNSSIDASSNSPGGLLPDIVPKTPGSPGS